MSESTFHFKKFTINQQRCAMKVGTDSVLFGAWIKTRNASSILDIGTGTGVLALMLAQKSNAQIDAIDVDAEACEQARENCIASPWADRIKVFHSTLQHFQNHAHAVYDLIVSNPPYFSSSHKASDAARNIARHMDATLSMEDLINGVLKLLSTDGNFCVILPQKEGMLFYEKALLHNLFCTNLTRVKTKIDKPEKRLMMEFSRKMQVMNEDEIVIQEADNFFTEDYIQLTKDFYPDLRKQR
ncbi:MAG: methyltransferase [Bacteroidia bacterium]